MNQMSTIGKKSRRFHLRILLLFITFKMQLSAESDTIFPGQTLSGNQAITSKAGIFELGFFALPVGVLGDDGNFVIRERSNPSGVPWQSSDHPRDTWLPGAKFGHDNLTGITTMLMAWKDKENPEPEPFSAEDVDSFGWFYMVLRNRSEIY